MKRLLFATHGDTCARADLRLLAQENAIDRASGAPIIYLPAATFTGSRRSSSVQHRLPALAHGQGPQIHRPQIRSGKIWAEGYEQGDLHSEVFPDVPPHLSAGTHSASRHLLLRQRGSAEVPIPAITGAET